MHGALCPFGAGIKHDKHSWDQAEDVAGSMLRLSRRARPCLAPGQPSQPTHTRWAT